MGDWHDTIEQILKDYVKKDDLRKLIEEIKYNHGWLAPGLDRYTANVVAEAFDQLLQVRRSAQLGRINDD